MPRGRERSGLCFAIPDDDADNQVGVVERGAKGVRDAIAQFAALVNGARNFGRAMAPQLSWKRKGAEELEQTRFVVALRRVDLGICPFQIAIRDHCRSAVSG